MAQPPNRSIPFVQGCYFGWVFELSSAALGCFENPRDTLQLRALWTSLDLVRAIIVWWFQRFLRGVETTKQFWLRQPVEALEIGSANLADMQKFEFSHDHLGHQFMDDRRP